MDDTDYRTYLLGQMPPAEADRLEDRLLQDEDLFQTLRSVEDDLFDDFARGQLADADRKAFVARFGDQGARVQFAQALARRTAHTASVRPFVAKPRARRVAVPVWLAAAAALALAIGAGVMMRNQTAAPGPATTTTMVNTTPTPTRPRVPAVMALVTLGTSRAAGKPAAIAIPSDAPELQLRVRLNPADRFDRYAVELRSSDNRVVWSGDDLHAAVENGDLILTASIPAAPLVNGTYEAAVRHGSDDLGFIALKVTRTP